MCYPDEFPDEQYLIRFDKMNSKGVCGIADDGHEVYMDSHSGIRPQFGDAWYCNLIRKEKDANHFYIANPVYKVEDKSGPFVDVSIQKTAESESPADMPEEESVTAIDNEGSEAQFTSELAGFVAIGDDTIYSPRLTAARYSVYRSFNGEHFEIIPDANGNIPCTRNLIALESLDDILDCDFPVRLDSIVKEDRIILNLTQ